MPVVDPDITSARGEIFEAETNLTRIARDNFNRRSGKQMLAGNIQMLLYSKEFAGQGRISEINSLYERNPSDAMLAWVVIVDGSPRSLIHQAEDNFKDKPRPSIYMDALLERAVGTANINETRVFNYDLISMAPEYLVPVVILPIGYPASNSVPHPKLHYKRYDINHTVFFNSFEGITRGPDNKEQH